MQASVSACTRSSCWSDIPIPCRARSAENWRRNCWSTYTAVKRYSRHNPITRSSGPGAKMQSNFYLKWSACVTMLTGAVLTALNIHPENIYLLNLGALLYLVWGYRIREWNLVVINVACIIIYTVGIYLS